MNITLIMTHHTLPATTQVKWECIPNYLTYTFSEFWISLTKESTNVVLVHPFQTYASVLRLYFICWLVKTMCQDFSALWEKLIFIYVLDIGTEFDLIFQVNPTSVRVENLPRLNSLRPRLNRRPFADDIFKCIFLNENEWILPRISLKYVSKVRINNILALVQIMAWRRPGDKPLSEPMMVSLLTHICVTRPQWVKYIRS